MYYLIKPHVHLATVPFESGRFGGPAAAESILSSIPQHWLVGMYSFSGASDNYSSSADSLTQAALRAYMATFAPITARDRQVAMAATGSFSWWALIPAHVETDSWIVDQGPTLSHISLRQLMDRYGLEDLLVSSQVTDDFVTLRPSPPGPNVVPLLVALRHHHEHDYDKLYN
ncbi:hypothetical protein BDZ89DRAFT_1080436 [Hymenopellis radicata]|nr:hypothetical protein BDZ89DRAFT_1080436 [Hymenopellis radicata]